MRRAIQVTLACSTPTKFMCSLDAIHTNINDIISIDNNFKHCYFQSEMPNIAVSFRLAVHSHTHTHWMCTYFIYGTLKCDRAVAEASCTEYEKMKWAKRKECDPRGSQSIVRQNRVLTFTLYVCVYMHVVHPVNPKALRLRSTICNFHKVADGVFYFFLSVAFDWLSLSLRMHGNAPNNKFSVFVFLAGLCSNIINILIWGTLYI